MMRAVHGSTVLYPSDATSTAGAGAGRWPSAPASSTCAPPAAPTRCCTDRDEAFPVGGAKVVAVQPGRPGDAGRRRCDPARLPGRSGPARPRAASPPGCIDLYSVKPIDTETLVTAAAATGDRLVVVEDHYPAGGIGSAVLEALNDAGHPARIVHLAVRGLPGSGTPAELMDAAGISTGHVVQAAREVLRA